MLASSPHVAAQTPPPAAQRAPAHPTAVAAATTPRPVAATHGIAMHGEPALPDGFMHFPYVDPDAPKGGRLRLGQSGTFDSLNGFIIKGNVAPGLREYVYDSLLVRSSDEPFTLYGLIAASIEVAPDRSAVTFRLRPQARFSDGTPLTAADVELSHKLLRDSPLPYYRSHYRKVARVEVLDPHAIRFVFKEGGDRELPLLLGLMPILPRHRVTAESISRTTLTPPIGSGPYVVTHVDPGRALTYERNPDYWARDLPPQRGRFNFDRIEYTFYRDNSTMFEAFKAGDIDARVETEPSQWAESYDFPAVRDGRVKKREFPVGLPAGMSGIALNTRRAPFDDPKVRAAFIQLFDADWINRSLYNGLYKRTESFFARSELSSTGRPANPAELSLLARFPGSVRPSLLDGSFAPPAGTASGRDRTGLERADRLFAEAGYGIRGGRMVALATGRPLELEFLARSRGQERLMQAYGEALRRLGIALRIRQVDDAQYWSRTKSFDFDMMQWTWSASLSPGNEQLNRWASAAADAPGSLNFPGVKNPAVDAMIDAMLVATERTDFVAAVRALDRTLLSGDYVVPLFYAPGQWLAWWDRFGMPARTPLAGADFDTWWIRTR